MSRAVHAVLFDVFGTVVDWRSSVAAEAGALLGLPPEGDGAAFAEQWRREGYLEPIGAIVRGERPYEDMEALLHETLLRVLRERRLALGDAETARLASVWRRLEPWPDVRSGLVRLKAHFVISPLSNGSFALLTELGRWAGLPWDCVISTELFGTYKPDPAAYLGACRLLGLPPSEVILVAAHPADLAAAGAAGLRTGYVPRPLEWGPGQPP